MISMRDDEVRLPADGDAAPAEDAAPYSRHDEETVGDEDSAEFVVVDLTEHDLELLPHRTAPFESTGAALAPIPEEGSAEHAAAVDLARTALAEVTDMTEVGAYAGLLDAGEGMYSLRFVSMSPGHLDWFWTVSLDRLDDEDAPSVLEVELLPGEDALLAPEWVPWAERLAEYRATHDRHGNPLPEDAEGEEPADGEPAPRADRARTSSRTRLRRRRRRDREGTAEATGDAAADQGSGEESEESVGSADRPDETPGELHDAADIREYAELRDQALDGVDFESDGTPPDDDQSGDERPDDVQADAAQADDERRGDEEPTTTRA